MWINLKSYEYTYNDLILNLRSNLDDESQELENNINFLITITPEEKVEFKIFEIKKVTIPEFYRVFKTTSG
jgi:hypothetical protein